VQAYVSVQLDERRVTVTVSSKYEASLTNALRELPGVAVTSINLKGKFHNQCHRSAIKRLTGFCESDSAFRFPPTVELPPALRLYDAADTGRLHEIALRAILLTKCPWLDIFRSLQREDTLSQKSKLLIIGPECSVPPSLRSVIQVTDSRDVVNEAADPFTLHLVDTEDTTAPIDSAIAVVGMACRTPGANDLDEFASLLKRGISQHVEVPKDRIDFDVFQRAQDPKRKWFGNFLDNTAAFDHKFFKKTAREMASTDPQHRLVLETAYQALEHAGYFKQVHGDSHIGCFIGIGLSDYENNIACHPPNAYSATGNLQSFAAGRISHYFGWTGPALTIDTACSSSAVALHQACQALRHGECSAALVCGVSLMTSPLWFQNLAGASFLSPTGQCKPFDASADGYCRGEAVGAVFLRDYKSAVRLGDRVLGNVAGTSVFQNLSCNAITVPHEGSLSNLFQTVTRQAGLRPDQISFVEAHGTGTPVGDPIEYASIRHVFGDCDRAGPLGLGSVKGLVGHSEAAAGIISLIKVLIMLYEGILPPQASFARVNPSLHCTPKDNIEIGTRLKPWLTEFRTALVNSYGASGSNASAVLTQAPRSPSTVDQAVSHQPHPLRVYGVDTKSLQRYASRLRQYIKDKGSEANIASIAHHLDRQCNPRLEYGVFFSAENVTQLNQELDAVAHITPDTGLARMKRARPVVLCFGGQNASFIGLQRQIYDRVTIFRYYLDKCDAGCQKLAVPSMFPEIFQKKTLVDPVRLQTMLFALQYACAKSWIACGLDVAAVVGHSFGELTALCVSGALSLGDALRVVVQRARLIRDHWGSDGGSMVVVEGSLATVEALLEVTNEVSQPSLPVNIACFNGPRMFTLAGSSHAVDVMCNTAREAPFSSELRLKRLDVTHAFHSALASPLAGHLKTLGAGVSFRNPAIPIERATKEQMVVSNGRYPSLLQEHMCKPVYFQSAVQRLTHIFPQAIWLEAGSNSSITSIVWQALGGQASHHSFHPINITSDAAFHRLGTATLSLWKEGVDVLFWAHHVCQMSAYHPLLLPPYQFEKTVHWLELKKPESQSSEPTDLPSTQVDDRLWKLVGYCDDTPDAVRFDINVSSELFRSYMDGHVIVQTASLTPSVLQAAIIVDALMSLRSEFRDGTYLPTFREFASHAPMTLDTTKRYSIHAKVVDAARLIWDVDIVCQTISESDRPMTLSSGQFVFARTQAPEAQAQFSRYGRLVRSSRCRDILECSDADCAIIQGPALYRAFSEIVQYSAAYQGLHKIVGKGFESAGRVTLNPRKENYIDTGLLDSFCQVAGIFLNCLSETDDRDMFVSTRIEQWSRTFAPHALNSWPASFDVYACHHQRSDDEIVSDVFVFDHESGELFEIILGIQYQRIRKDAMRRILSSTSKPGSSHRPAINITTTMGTSVAPKSTGVDSSPVSLNVWPQVQAILSDLCGLEPTDVSQNSQLGDIGIDSLMGMELAREIEGQFHCSLDYSVLNEVIDVAGLYRHIQDCLGMRPLPETVKPALPIVDYSISNGGDSRGGDNSWQHLRAMPAGKSIATIALEAFPEVRRATDSLIVSHGLQNYQSQVLPKSNKLVVAHILEAWESLGCLIRSIPAGETLPPMEHLSRHKRFVTFLYGLLENVGHLVEAHDDGARIIRTSIPAPIESAETLAQELFQEHPEHIHEHQLTHFTGKRLADCLVGKADILQLVFGSAEGRDISSKMYSQSPINFTWIKQMEDLLERVLSEAECSHQEPIKILEMGAGTGGTTEVIAPLLARLEIPVIYTVTDLSSSFVAGARKRFKQYPFMQFQVHDIEAEPSDEMAGSQHIVLATNAVHATRSLRRSTASIRRFLRPDGFLLLLEMTQLVPWVDMVYGLVEGWWLFGDERSHALAPPAVWEQSLRDAGYNTIQWTDGHLPEANIQCLILATLSHAGEPSEDSQCSP
jgi:acyl transferase domain-containing protein/SAM-dependent methyltransferase/acyl carrier protein